MHLPVLLAEVLATFKDVPLQTFVDGTLGAGGHSASILKNHPELQCLIGIDQDPLALQLAKEKLHPWLPQTTLISDNFENLKSILQKLGLKSADGILLDLGVSSMQLDRPEKGFSFMRDGPLDMRMNPNSALTAADIVNHWSEQDLGRIFRDYGEEKRWRAAARAVVEKRQQHPILTTFELVATLMPIMSWKKHGMHPLTLIFQGLRICVNRELEIIEKVIPEAIDLLSPGGRLAIITFHSLEDRIVKNAFRFAASDKYNTEGIGGVFLDKEPLVNIVTKKPICASPEEVTDNPRSRSAKLRVVEKVK